MAVEKGSKTEVNRPDPPTSININQPSRTSGPTLSGKLIYNNFSTNAVISS